MSSIVMRKDSTFWAVVVGAPGCRQLALSAHSGRDAHAAAAMKDHGPELQAWTEMPLQVKYKAFSIKQRMHYCI